VLFVFFVPFVVNVVAGDGLSAETALRVPAFLTPPILSSFALSLVLVLAALGVLAVQSFSVLRVVSGHKRPFGTHAFREPSNVEDSDQ